MALVEGIEHFEALAAYLAYAEGYLSLIGEGEGQEVVHLMVNKEDALPLPVPLAAHTILKPELAAFFEIGDVHGVVHNAVRVQVIEPDVDGVGVSGQGD